MAILTRYSFPFFAASIHFFSMNRGLKPPSPYSPTSDIDREVGLILPSAPQLLLNQVPPHASPPPGLLAKVTHPASQAG